jgi:hypothetical protein
MTICDMRRLILPFCVGIILTPIPSALSAQAPDPNLDCAHFRAVIEAVYHRVLVHSAGREERVSVDPRAWKWEGSSPSRGHAWIENGPWTAVRRSVIADLGMRVSDDSDVPCSTYDFGPGNRWSGSQTCQDTRLVWVYFTTTRPDSVPGRWVTRIHANRTDLMTSTVEVTTEWLRDEWVVVDVKILAWIMV